MCVPGVHFRAQSFNCHPCSLPHRMSVIMERSAENWVDIRVCMETLTGAVIDGGDDSQPIRVGGDIIRESV